MCITHNIKRKGHTTMTKYIAVTETAKLIRAALKEAFPEVKFSVKTRKYSGGSSIDVSWQEGPTSEQVKAIAGAFEGGYFDGMTDYRGSHNHMMNGEDVSFGGSFVFCARNVPNDKIEKATAIFEKVGKDNWIDFMERMGLDRQYAWRLFDNHASRGADSLAYIFMHNVSNPQFEGRTSKLAASVTLHRSY